MRQSRRDGVVMGEMADLAREVVTMLEIDDRASDLELVASGVDFTRWAPHRKEFCTILRVTTELVRGRLQFVVEYLDNHAHHKDENGEEVFTHGWERAVYYKDDWEGVAGFVDGFLGSGSRSDYLELHRRTSEEEGRRNAKPLCGWFFERNSRDDKTRTLRFRSAVKALLGQPQKS